MSWNRLSTLRHSLQDIFLCPVILCVSFFTVSKGQALFKIGTQSISKSTVTSRHKPFLLPQHHTWSSAAKISRQHILHFIEIQMHYCHFVFIFSKKSQRQMLNMFGMISPWNTSCVCTFNVYIYIHTHRYVYSYTYTHLNVQTVKMLIPSRS